MRDIVEDISQHLAVSTMSSAILPTFIVFIEVVLMGFMCFIYGVQVRGFGGKKSQLYVGLNSRQ